MIPANITVQELCQLLGYKELCNFSLGKQVEELTKQLADKQAPHEPPLVDEKFEPEECVG